MLANYLIGLREGLEASLIIGILVAYLTKIGRRDQLPQMWAGVGIAVVISLGAGALLTWGPYRLTEEGEEALAGLLSLLAVALVTWMVFWMASRARGLASTLRDQVDAAVLGTGAGLAVIAAVTVSREGVETALFIWATVNSTGDAVVGVLGALLGIATAIAIGFLISKGLLRINLGTFFRWTGVFLIVVAAGVLAYAVGEFQEVGWLPGEELVAYDVSGAIPRDSWYGALLSGLLGFNASPTLFQVFAWVAYIGIVLPIFLVTSRHRRSATETPEGAEAEPVAQAAEREAAHH